MYSVYHYYFILFFLGGGVHAGKPRQVTNFTIECGTAKQCIDQYMVLYRYILFGGEVCNVRLSCRSAVSCCMVRHVISSLSQDGRTALHHAVEYGAANNDLQMARLLLSYGADANVRDEVRCFRICSSLFAI